MADSRALARLKRAASSSWTAFRTARVPRLVEQRSSSRDSRPLLAFLAVSIAVLGIAEVLLPSGVPPDVVVLGALIGGLNALPAIGLVLVFRANRIVNFAQGDLGSFAATLAFLFMTTLGWSWFYAVPVSLLAGVLVASLVEFGIVRRFSRAPRLVLTVATIGVAQFLGGLRLGIPGFFPDLPAGAGSFPTPFSDFHFSFGQGRYSGNDLMIVVVVPIVVIAIAFFLRGTWAGLGARAAAEDVERTRLLGVTVGRLSTIVWGLAGLLSALTAILRAPVTGFSLFTASGSGTGNLVRALVPAAVGGFQNLPLTFGSAVLLGIIEQAFFWNFSRGGPIVTLLLVVLLAALLIRGAGRAAFRAAEEVSSWAVVGDVRRIPRAVARLPEARLLRFLGAVILFGGLGFLPAFSSPGQVVLVSLIGVHVLAGMSLIVLSGWTGQVSLGQWALVGVGAYVTANVASRWGADFFVVLILSTLAGGLVSVILGAPAQRMPGILYGATTLAFAVAASNWLFELPILGSGTQVERPVLFGRFDMNGTNSFYYLALVATIAGVIATRNLKRFRLAGTLLAARDNPRAAEAFGISVAAARRKAFFLSGCLAGFAGALYAFHQGVAVANRFPAEHGITILAMAVIGGLGSVPGVVIGAVFLRGTQYLLPGWAQFFVTGFGLLVVLLVFPGGIGEVLFRLRYRLMRRLALRRGIVLTPAGGVSLEEPVPEAT